ncbi:hypothetical protein N7510_005100 [Penicillium lagena]|uniref:uncharacterized protein n=1 Tax=Penicillium lagena TaxID=94218 RepID=UPI00253FC10A|nr:uncharacterized protein N7510_005100 [Penicillium lagena]KAJ5621116.1 hypothetical protein N7510_005100 [Penicillium lagena]
MGLCFSVPGRRRHPMGMGMMGGGMMGGGMMGGGWGPPPARRYHGVLVDITGVWDTAGAGAGEAPWAVDMVTVQVLVAEDLVALDQGVDLEAEDDVAGDVGVDEIMYDTATNIKCTHVPVTYRSRIQKIQLGLIVNRKTPNKWVQ